MSIDQSNFPKSGPEESTIPFEARVAYWARFVTKEHREEMRLLLDQAGLGGRPAEVDGKFVGWNNVVKHQVAEAAAVRVLGRELGMSNEDIATHERFAFIHNATKRLEKRPEHFSEEERQALSDALEPIYQETDPTGELRVSMTPNLFPQIIKDTRGKDIDEKIAKTPWPQLLQYYIDALFIDGRLVHHLERIAEVEARIPLNDDVLLTHDLNMPYWHAERLVSGKIQTIIWQKLQEAGFELSSADEVPAFIRQKIEEEMVNHWLEIHGKESIVTSLEKDQTAIEVATWVDTKRTNSAGQIAPEKNEDAGILRQKGNIVIAGMFDGATDISDVKLPMSPGKAAAVACREAINHASFDESPTEMLIRGNQFIRGLASGLPLTPEQQSEIFTAVGAAARIDLAKHTIDIASIADCHIVVVHEDGTHDWLTQNTSDKVERVEIAAALWGAENPDQPLPDDETLMAYLDDAMKRDAADRPKMKPLEDERVLGIIGRNRRLENKPGGQPSLKGSDDETVRSLIQTASASVQKGDTVYLFTDGAYPGPIYTKEQQEMIVDVLKLAGLEGIYGWVRAAESLDAGLQTYPRMKQYDDFAAMEITVSK